MLLQWLARRRLVWGLLDLWNAPEERLFGSVGARIVREGERRPIQLVIFVVLAHRELSLIEGQRGGRGAQTCAKVFSRELLIQDLTRRDKFQALFLISIGVYSLVVCIQGLVQAESGRFLLILKEGLRERVFWLESFCVGKGLHVGTVVNAAVRRVLFVATRLTLQLVLVLYQCATRGWIVHLKAGDFSWTLTMHVIPEPICHERKLFA